MVRNWSDRPADRFVALGPLDETARRAPTLETRTGAGGDSVALLVHNVAVRVHEEGCVSVVVPHSIAVAQVQPCDGIGSAVRKDGVRRPRVKREA